MNKLTALITALFVAASSTAMAAPATISAFVPASFSANGSWSSGDRSEVNIRDHRDRGHRENTGPLQPQWLDWAEMGVRSGMAPSYIQLPRGEQFRYLLLQAENGRPMIDSVFVRYHDGTQYQIDTSALRLNGRGAIVPLNIRATTIHQIIFYPRAGSTGTFATAVAF